MKLSIVQAALGSAAILFAGCNASSAHQRLHRSAAGRLTHAHGHAHSKVESTALEKRSTCAFPTDDPNMVAVTPDQQNAGWAMSPDQPCKPGSYCPFACKPGMVMNQWDPKSTYTYPSSMNGGLYCDNSGKVKQPFPGKPNCVEGVGSVKAVNKCKSKMTFCQTVLPGCESMLISTLVHTEATLAVPDPSYWQSTAAHFYINPPGTGPEDCIWGTDSKPIGNWAQFVAGANTDGNGNTFVKLGYNPVWESSGLSSTKPDFGVKIECPNGGCEGLPCQINPSTSGKVVSNLAASGAGGSNFCVVTVKKGSQAHIVAFDGSGGHSDDSPKDTPKPSPTPTPEPSTSEEPSTPPPPPPPTTSEEPTTTSTPEPTTSTEPSTTIQSTTSSKRPVMLPGIFHENGTSIDNSTTTTTTMASSTAAQTTAPVPVPPQPTEKKGEAGRQQGSALAGLVVAFVAAAYLF